MFSMRKQSLMVRDLIETGKIPPIQKVDLASFVKNLYRPELLEKISGTKQPAL